MQEVSHLHMLRWSAARAANRGEGSGCGFQANEINLGYCDRRDEAQEGRCHIDEPGQDAEVAAVSKAAEEGDEEVEAGAPDELVLLPLRVGVGESWHVDVDGEEGEKDGGPV